MARLYLTHWLAVEWVVMNRISLSLFLLFLDTGAVCGKLYNTINKWWFHLLDDS